MKLTGDRTITALAGLGALAVVLSVSALCWKDVYHAIRPEARFFGRWETSGYEKPEGHGIKRRPVDRFVYDFGERGMVRFSHQTISSHSTDQVTGAVQLHWRDDFSDFCNYRLSRNTIVFSGDARKPFARKTYLFEGTEVLILRDEENNVEKLRRLGRGLSNPPRK